MSIKKQLRKTFTNFLKSLSIPRRVYAEDVLRASSHNTYIETIGKKADGLHYHIDKIEREILGEKFQEYARKKIRGLRIKNADVIVDITEEDFYGKSTGLSIHPWTGKDGVKGKFRYLVAGIVFRNKILPFYACILRRGSFTADLLGEIIEICNAMQINVRLMKLDRGFYSGEVIDRLELEGMHYLIFARKSNLFKCMLESVGKSAIIKHEIRYNKDKSSHIAKTKIALIKDVDGHDWCFATNHCVADATKYVKLYRGRWNIETMFRVHDEARIKTKSIKPVTRFFYFILSMLLLLIWNLYAKNEYAFKAFVIMLDEITPRASSLRRE